MASSQGSNAMGGKREGQAMGAGRKSHGLGKAFANSAKKKEPTNTKKHVSETPFNGLSVLWPANKESDILLYMISVFRYLGMSKYTNMILEGSFSIVSKNILQTKPHFATLFEIRDSTIFRHFCTNPK